jgi:hypothetical protein
VALELAAMVGPLIEIARARRAEVRAVYLDVRLQVCLARNAGRVVCPLMVFTLLENRLVPPILDEGFDQVDVVTSGDGS